MASQAEGEIVFTTVDLLVVKFSNGIKRNEAFLFRSQ